MEDQYKKNIRPILDYFDQLSFLFKDKPISIPKMVVVGAQSSGKSSVLESISGIELPRGVGIVTRCPIMIQLRCASTEESATIGIQGTEEKNLEKITLGQIAEKLVNYQKKLLENNGKLLLTKQCIQLKVFRNNAPDLTLIDLPGITHQNDEDYKVIKDIIKEYIQGEETIILLILSSTEDVAANEAISIIRENEPQFGKRTIPILSKIDWAIQNSRMSLVNNVQTAVTLGCEFQPVLVRNRTQDEIEKNVPYEEVRLKEENLINSTEQLKPFLGRYQGINGLIELLVNVQKEKLLQSKTQLKLTLKNAIIEAEKELEKLPKACEKREDFNRILDACCKKYNEEKNKKLKNVQSFMDEKPTYETSLPTKIRRKLEEHRNNFIQLFYKFFTKEFYINLDKYVEDSIGLKFVNFYGEECIYNILEFEIAKIFESCNTLPDEINEMIVQETESLLKEAFSINENLQSETLEIYHDIIINNKEECMKLYEHLQVLENHREFTLNDQYRELTEVLYEKIIDDDDVGEKAYSENLFYFSTKLVKENFEKFIGEVSEFKENKYFRERIKMLCSIYSYLLIFMNRFLDVFYNGITYHLFEYIKGNNLTDEIRSKFNNYEFDILKEKMNGNLAVLNKIQALEKNIKLYKDAMEHLNNLGNATEES